MYLRVLDYAWQIALLLNCYLSVDCFSYCVIVVLLSYWLIAYLCSQTHFKIFNYIAANAMQPMQQSHCSWCFRACVALSFLRDIEMRVHSSLNYNILNFDCNLSVHAELWMWKAFNGATLHTFETFLFSVLFLFIQLRKFWFVKNDYICYNDHSCTLEKSHFLWYNDQFLTLETSHLLLYFLLRYLYKLWAIKKYDLVRICKMNK